MFSIMPTFNMADFHKDFGNPAPMYKNTIKTKSFLTNYHVEELIGSAWHPFLIHDNLKSAQSDMDYYQKEWGGKFRIISVLEETKD